MMTTYAVTAATGRFGQAALRYLTQLIQPNDTLVALARNLDKAAELLPEGIDLRAGDYTDQAALTTALTGVDRLLFISGQPGQKVSREMQHQNVIDAAKAAGVTFIAYTSFPQAPTNPAALAADHKATESALAASGIAHSFLRNNWYLENETAPLKAGATGKPFVYAAADGQAGWALEREYAEAAAIVLTSAAPKPIYEFAGAPHTYADLAEAIEGDVLIKPVTPAEYQQGLEEAGLARPVAELLTSFQTLIRDGGLQPTTDDLQEVLGRPLTPLPAAIQEVLD